MVIEPTTQNLPTTIPIQQVLYSLKSLRKRNIVPQQQEI